MSLYAWVIDVDHFPTEGASPSTNANAKGMVGPRDAAQHLVDELRLGKGQRFEMYDGDGECYYDGRIVFDFGPDDGEDFGPLDDFGTPNAGCVRIDYLDDGVWSTL